MIKNKWLEYTWKKCSLDTFYRRMKKWYSFEESIKQWHLAKINNWIKDYWRKCNCCNKFKENLFFTTNRSICKECARQKYKEYHLKNKNKISERRKNNRKLESENIKTRLDSIFYKDKNIKKVIEIQWKSYRSKLARRWEIKKDKFFYFLSRWYEREFLSKIYWNYYLNTEMNVL